jgi:tetratricopeptide (TPR) repeat protein
MFELKPIEKGSIPRAIEKAERYRLLNEPVEAESICRDILEVDPQNQKALIVLLLALTDQFETGIPVSDAQEILAGLGTEYDKAYYAGIICERRGKALMDQGSHGSGFVAYDWFLQAIRWYEKAASIRPKDNDDSILRYNTCVRILNRNPDLKPSLDERIELPLE